MPTTCMLNGIQHYRRSLKSLDYGPRRAIVPTEDDARYSIQSKPSTANSAPLDELLIGQQ